MTIAIRILVGLILLLAGFFKLRAGQRWFYAVVQSYQLTSNSITTIISYILPYFELFLGLSLILGFFEWWSSLISFLLLSFFTILVSITYFRGINIDCGCFGKSKLLSKQKSSKSIIQRNIILSSFLLLNLFLISPSNFGQYNHLFHTLVSRYGMILILSIWLFSLVLGINVKLSSDRR